MATASCTIDEKNIKIFTKVVQALAKIGDELYFDFTKSQVKVQSVNSTQSCYACFALRSMFFSTFDLEPNVDADASSPVHLIHCKLPIKSAIFVFRSPNFDRQVRTVEISKSSNIDNLEMRLNCKFSVVKTFTFVILDSEPIRTNFSKSAHRNCMTIESSTIHESLQAFKQGGVEEVTLKAYKEYIIIQNHLDFEPEKSVKTEVKLKNEEFINFDIVVEMEITFCLREFRALVSFAESLHLPITVSFDRPGGPCIVTCDVEGKVECELALATLDMDQNQAPQPSTPVTTQQVNCDLLQAVDTDDIPNANNEVEQDQQFIPPSPKSKKFRSRFLNLSQLTLHASQLPSKDANVLAEDSDPDCD